MIREEDDLAGSVLPKEALPADWRQASLVGRIDQRSGPTPFLVSDGILYDTDLQCIKTALFLASDDAWMCAGHDDGVDAGWR